MVKSIDLLEAMGNIHDRYILEAHKKPEQGSRVVSLRKVWFIAAVLALLMLLAGCVAVLLSLSDLSIGKQNIDAGFQQTQPMEMLSLQSYMDSDTYQAAKQWQDFLEDYDPEGTKLAEADQLHQSAPMEYMAYLCYTQEMQDKIDSICSQYGLSLLGPMYTAQDAFIMVQENLGIETLFAQEGFTVHIESGHCYQDGSFSFYGTTQLLGIRNLWPHRVHYEYHCNQKTSFHDLFLAVEDVNAFSQWEHTLPNGTTLLLALSQERALILADTQDCFVSVNILNPAAQDGTLMTHADLEAIADTFRFDYAPVWQDSDNLVKLQWVLADLLEASETPELTFFSSEYEKTVTLSEYRSLFGSGEVVLSIPKQAEVDMDGDGTPETLLWLRVNNANDYGILVLHREEGILRGDSFAYRQMFQVKQDGTFSYSGQEDGVGRLRFDSGVPVIEPISSTGQEEKEDLLWSDYPG